MTYRGRTFGSSVFKAVVLGGIAAAVVLGGLVVVLVVLATSSGSAPHASQTIKRLEQLDIANNPPPGGVLLGRASDKGDGDTGFGGRRAGIETVFATDLSPAGAVDYYKRTYPEYNFGGSGLQLPSASSQGLGGSPVLPGLDSVPPVERLGASITIQANTGHPYVVAHLNPKLAKPPAGADTYVVIYITDQPRDASGAPIKRSN